VSLLRSTNDVGDSSPSPQKWMGDTEVNVNSKFLLVMYNCAYDMVMQCYNIVFSVKSEAYTTTLPH